MKTSSKNTESITWSVSAKNVTISGSWPTPYNCPMPASKDWLCAPTITLQRTRQSLSDQEHSEILEILLPGSPAHQRILDLRSAVFGGARANLSENQSVGHWALRLAGVTEKPAIIPAVFSPANENLLPRFESVHAQTRSLVDAIHRGEFRSTSGKQIRQIIHLGIGGSDLGPQLLIKALDKLPLQPKIATHFLSNLDYHAVDHCLATLDPTETIVIIASKSFSTEETMVNASHLMQWMEKAAIPTPERNLIAVTSEVIRAREWRIPQAQILWFDQSIGGRYSLWGPVSITARLALGNACIDEFLSGGVAMDAHFLSQPLSENMPAVLAATDFYNLRTRGLPTLMVSAYDSRLGLLVPYLKQLWMESLGKHIDTAGQPIDGPACPILWGDIGTNAQHAFFQLLHQGAHGVAVDLVGILRPEHQAHTSHQALLANLIAQSQALSTGHPHDDAQKTCWGGHPLNLFMLDRCDAVSLGALIALWEHRVLCLAAINQINPFDQWGVALGKSIARSVTSALNQDSAKTGSGSIGLDSASIAMIQWINSRFSPPR